MSMVKAFWQRIPRMVTSLFVHLRPRCVRFSGCCMEVVDEQEIFKFFGLRKYVNRKRDDREVPVRVDAAI